MYRIDIAIIATDDDPEANDKTEQAPHMLEFKVGETTYVAPQLTFRGEDVDELVEDVKLVLNFIKGAYHD